MKFASERDNTLGDVLGEVPDALEIVRHARRADDLAQIDRHGLPAGDGEHGFFLDFRLQRVDLGIGGHGTLRALEIAFGERVDRVGNLLLAEAAHLRHQAGNLLQIDVEGLCGVIGDDHRFSS